MKLTGYGKVQWGSSIILGLIIGIGAPVMSPSLWWISLTAAIVVFCSCMFFRDPYREIPSTKDIMLAPADGRISSIHEIKNYQPFGEDALCIRIFLSVFDVHINRMPCHGRIASITHTPGKHLNVLNPESAEVNEANLIVINHISQKHPIAAVRQLAGLIARKIVCGVEIGDCPQRGQRIGMMKFGSTTELIIPKSLQPMIKIEKGQYVYGAQTVFATITPKSNQAIVNPKATQATDN